MSDSYLVTCEYCGTQTIRRSARQKYCNLTCSNRAQYRKYKERTKQESAVTIPTAPDTAHSKATVIRDVSELPGALIDSEQLARDTQSFLDEFKAKDRTEQLPQDTEPKLQRPMVLTGEALAKARRLAEEERLLKLVKDERAERKRQRMLARGREIDQATATGTTKSNEELKKELGDRWVDKDLEDI